MSRSARSKNRSSWTRDGRPTPGAPFYDTRFNAGGFNDVEHTLIRAPNVKRRIVAIGDSVAVGVVPHSSNYLTLLGPARAGDGSVEVVNLGVSATDPRDYLAILVNEGLAFQPDVVLVGLFVGNDFEVARRKPYEYSYAATLVNALWRIGRAGVPAATTANGLVAEYRDDEPSVARNRFFEIEVDRAWVYVKDGVDLQRASARVTGHLREMRDISTRVGADFAVVLIPDEAQVDRELQDEVVRASGRGRDQLDFDRPNRVIAADLTGAGIHVLDLLPAFRTAGRQARLYKPQDTHWNLAGNRLAATTIAAFLR